MPLFGRKKPQSQPEPARGAASMPFDLPQMPAAEMLAAVRHAVQGAPLPEGRGPGIALGVVHHLLGIMQDPAGWPHLKPGERLALLQVGLFFFALDSRPERHEFMRIFYPALAGMMSEDERLYAIRSIVPALRAGVNSLDELVPFIAWDDSPAVVSTASLECALLTELEHGDPMTGVKTVRDLALKHGQAGERGGAMLAGLVMHGDHRVPAVLHQTWRHLSPEAQRTLALDVAPGLLLTTSTEFHLQWLEDPEARHPELPAQALARLPIYSRHDGIVREMERTLPVDYQTTPEEDRRNPQIRTIREWSIPEYGWLIQPRLQAVLNRNPSLADIRVAMTAWS